MTAAETTATMAADNDDKIESVYPEIRDFYRQHPSLDYFPSALDRTRRFFDKMTEGNEITKRIDALYRVMPGGGGKEYVYYAEQWLANDYLGNEANWGWTVGRVEVPKAHMEWVADEGKILATSIERTETKYNIEYNEKNLKEILPLCHNTTQFIINTGNQLYSTTRNSWMNDSFDDCVEFAQTGKRVRGSDREREKK